MMHLYLITLSVLCFKGSLISSYVMETPCEQRSLISFFEAIWEISACRVSWNRRKPKHMLKSLKAVHCPFKLCLRLSQTGNPSVFASRCTPVYPRWDCVRVCSLPSVPGESISLTSWEKPTVLLDSLDEISKNVQNLLKTRPILH